MRDLLFKIFASLILFIATLPLYANELQDLINRSVKSDRIVNLVKGKVYIIDKPISMYDNVRINGNSATLTQSKNWRSSNGPYEPLIKLIGVKGVKISNLVINHTELGYDPKNQPSSSITIMNANNCSINNVTFENSGIKYNTKNVKGTPFLLIVAQNKPGEFTYIPSDARTLLASVSNIVIDNCKFINTDLYCSFAIRLVTNWLNYTPTESVKNKISNCTISNSLFKGEYDWNTIELAGSGTINTTIYRNHIIGKSLGNIDLDKGTNGNKVDGNIIEKSGLPNRHKSRRDVRFHAISVHGGKELKTKNSVVTNNIIRDVENPKIANSRYLYSSAIGVYYTENTIIRGNKMSNIFANQDIGAGIILDQDNDNVDIQKNSIDKAYRGIFEAGNSRKNSRVKIGENSINVKKEKVYLKK